MNCRQFPMVYAKQFTDEKYKYEGEWLEAMCCTCLGADVKAGSFVWLGVGLKAASQYYKGERLLRGKKFLLI